MRKVWSPPHPTPQKKTYKFQEIKLSPNLPLYSKPLTYSEGNTFKYKDSFTETVQRRNSKTFSSDKPFQAFQIFGRICTVYIFVPYMKYLEEKHAESIFRCASISKSHNGHWLINSRFWDWLRLVVPDCSTVSTMSTVSIMPTMPTISYFQKQHPKSWA